MNLANELRAGGLDMDETAFCALVARQFRARFFCWSADELLAHIEAATDFVARVRSACGCPKLSAAAVVRALRLLSSPRPAHA